MSTVEAHTVHELPVQHACVDCSEFMSSLDETSRAHFGFVLRFMGAGPFTVGPDGLLCAWHTEWARRRGEGEAS